MTEPTKNISKLQSSQLQSQDDSATLSFYMASGGESLGTSMLSEGYEVGYLSYLGHVIKVENINGYIRLEDMKADDDGVVVIERDGRKYYYQNGNYMGCENLAMSEAYIPSNEAAIKAHDKMISFKPKPEHSAKKFKRKKRGRKGRKRRRKEPEKRIATENKAIKIEVPKKPEIVKPSDPSEKIKSDAQAKYIPEATVNVEAAASLATTEAIFSPISNSQPNVPVVDGATYLVCGEKDDPRVNEASESEKNPILDFETRFGTKAAIYSGVLFCVDLRDKEEGLFVTEPETGITGREVNSSSIPVNYNEIQLGHEDFSSESEQEVQEVAFGLYFQVPFKRETSSERPTVKFKIAQSNELNMNPHNFFAAALVFGRGGSDDPLLVAPRFPSIPVSFPTQISGPKIERPERIANASDPEQADDDSSDRGSDSRQGRGGREESQDNQPEDKRRA